MVIRNTVGSGRAQGLATAWLHALGVGLYALLTAFGLALVIAQSRTVYLTLTGAGAAYLLYLGATALTSRVRVNIQDAGPGISTARAAREGFFTALLNPKVAIFFTAVFSQFLRPGMGSTDHLLMSVTASAVDGLWYSLVAVLLTHAHWADLLRRRAPVVDRVTGTVLILLAIAGVIRIV